MYAQVCFPFFINKTFTYNVPELLRSNIRPGSLVEVKFKNKPCKGFVVALSQKITFKGHLNDVLDIDSTKSISDELWQTLIWMSEYYVTPIGKITQTVLSWAFKNPKTLKSNSLLNKYKHTNIYNLVLSPLQNTIYKQINKLFVDSYKPHFLYGVPGSGKTELYLQLTNDFLSQNKSCLILTPEIILSSQIFQRFQNYFGDKVLLWHSQASDAYKRKALQKINEDSAYVVVGARSALFTPLYNLGLIIVDEEHDSSYKESERQPCYNARDLAIIRGKYSKSLVVLGSATPSLETYYNSMVIDKYYMHELPERYGNSVLPKIKIVNMTQNHQKQLNQHILSSDLIQTMHQTLDRGEQILILHNRRGFSSIAFSNESDDVLKCHDCDIVLTFHAHLNQLICHHCHQKHSFDKYTNKDIKFLGYGTEQLELILNETFPNVGILRLDVDSAKSMSKQKTILNQFKNKECSILLGTQMIAKGLDFNNVTLVAIVNTDLGMLIPDFKSHEKMFQLIYQVIGRSGRSNKMGKAIIQTYQPDNHIIQMATTYDSKKFYNLTLNNRHALHYPPFVRLIRILVQSKTVQDCINSSNNIYNILKSDLEQFIIGPLPCPIEKLSNQTRYHILIKTPHKKLKFVLNKIKRMQDKKDELIHKNVKLLIDVDSNSIL